MLTFVVIAIAIMLPVAIMILIFRLSRRRDIEFEEVIDQVPTQQSPNIRSELGYKAPVERDLPDDIQKLIDKLR